MTFKGYIRRVYVLYIENKIHTEPLIQYVCSSIKYSYTCPFFGSAVRLSTSTVQYSTAVTRFNICSPPRLQTIEHRL